MGAFILGELIERGVPTTAVVRMAGAVTATDLVTPAVADVYDTTALAGVLDGATTVVSAFNPGWDDPELYDRYLQGAHSIQDAAIAAGVERLIIVGGASSLYGADGRQLIESGLPPEPYGSGVRAARDYLDEIKKEDRIDWVYLSPPSECGPMGPTGRTGRYRLGGDHPVLDSDGRNSISREDLAVALADEVLHPAHHRARFTVGY
jgi:uncharacterized protein